MQTTGLQEPVSWSLATCASVSKDKNNILQDSTGMNDSKVHANKILGRTKIRSFTSKRVREELG
jgi:hypothetical protein